MDDTISRRDAIDAILALTNFRSVRALYEYVQWLDQPQTWSSGINDAIDVVIRLPSAQQWIPVSSGLLPKAEHGESEDVLCQLENMRRIVLYFDGSNWCYPSGELYIGVNYENGWSNKVVAWMPLPKLWEGEEDEVD